MRIESVSALCVTTLLVGCCISPPEQALTAAAPVAAPVVTDMPAPEAPADAETTVAAVPAAEPAAAEPAVAAVAPPAAAPLPPGTTFAYEDVGISVRVPDGWTQQLMTGGVVALFSGDYPTSGTRDRGALMLISKQPGGLPADDPALETVLKEGLDPAAVKQAGPVRFPIGGKQAGQIIAKGSDEDGATYDAMHTIIQSGGNAVSVKAMAFDSLNQRKTTFDGVMESITFTGG
jgi:hypothetical protein